MDIDFSKWLEQGPMVAALVIAVIYFYRRETRTDKKMDSAMKKCEDREQRLIERIGSLEDRQYSDSKTLLQTCANVIETNCRTFEQLTKSETDKFRAIQPKEQQ